MGEPMIDGQGELSLEQVREITDSWNMYSDWRPLVAERLWKEINHLKKLLSNTTPL